MGFIPVVAGLKGPGISSIVKASAEMNKDKGVYGPEHDVFYEGGGVKSIRIEKDKTGKASGFWKGITSTEAQEFTYSVGITSTDSNSTTKQSAEKLNTSL